MSPRSPFLAPTLGTNPATALPAPSFPLTEPSLPLCAGTRRLRFSRDTRFICSSGHLGRKTVLPAVAARGQGLDWLSLPQA